MVSVRTFLTVVAAHNWELHQMEVYNAFLHGEEVYIRLPPDYHVRRPGMVCRLKKSLYGLRQAPHCLFAKLAASLNSCGFTRVYSDYSHFVFRKGPVRMHLLVYVDDLILSGNNSSTLVEFKLYLGRCVHMKDLGVLKYFLGVEVAWSPDGIFLSQHKYTLDIISEIGLLGSKPAALPIEQNHSLALAKGAEFADPERDLVMNIRMPHYEWSAILKVPRDKIVFLGGSPISWKTKKQKTVSRTSAEAEYRSMAALTTELKWLNMLFLDPGVLHFAPMTLFCDSQSALHIAQNPVFHERTKHIEVDCHYICDAIQDGTLKTTHVTIDVQLANIFTKALGKRKFLYLLRKLGTSFFPTPT
ncbi:transmembrane signal receptor [Lithospermum erythrorhizon]|uniref:Transmembrane signal receptor n=1 Tax=Lithospermum erythrorhizon TaxID=34254 RepID=A0AAV3R4U4_LITER